MKEKKTVLTIPKVNFKKIILWTCWANEHKLQNSTQYSFLVTKHPTFHVFFKPIKLPKVPLHLQQKGSICSSKLEWGKILKLPKPKWIAQ